MRFSVGIFLLPLLALWAAPPVPYYGKVSIDEINYHGSAQFSFSLKDANGTEHWRNGVDANESIRVFVVNGRYSVMLGGQGMNPLPPELFLQHEELYLSVSFDTGDGPRSLGPDQLITVAPRSLVAEVAKVAKVAEKLSGAITSDMLSPEVRSKLDANQSAAPMGPITRDMLPADVLADLNRTDPAVGPITLSMLAPEVTAKLESNASGGTVGPITLDMLPADVLADLNKTITRDMLPADVLADLNKSAPAVGPITLSMLAEVTAKLDQNTTLADGSVTANKLANNTITTSQLNEQILKYLKPEITGQPTGKVVYADSNVSFSVSSEGKYLTYQWKKDGSDIGGGTNATLTITDANSTQHDGNYSVVVSNDFGSVESNDVEILVSDSLTFGLLAWWPFDGNGSDMSGNARHSTPSNTFSYVAGKVNQAIRVEGDKNDPAYGISGGHIIIPYISSLESGNFSISMWVKEEQMHYSHGEDYISFGDFIYIGNRLGVTFNSQVDTSIIRNQWNHILFIFKTTSKIGFLNGENVVTENWAAPEVINLTNSAISRHWWDNGNRSSTRLTGSFDDIRIYDRALSAAEVQALYSLGQ